MPNLARVYPERGNDGVRRWVIDDLPHLFASGIETKEQAIAQALVLVGRFIVLDEETKGLSRR